MTLSQAGWRDLFTTRPDLEAIASLARWPEQNWPVVVRRPDQQTREHHVALGIPLPPDCGKLRVAVETDPVFVTSAEAPPTLADIRPAAPPHWLLTLDALLDLGSTLGMMPHVFGSFAWQGLTGLPYVTGSSDLDLLWPVSPHTDTLLASLPAIEAQAPGAVDGEVTCDGAAVNWRELAHGTEQVLVKSIVGVQLTSRAAFLARAAQV